MGFPENGRSARNSLSIYFALINLSLSSLSVEYKGLFLGLTDSHRFLDILLPICIITDISSGLEERKSKTNQCIMYRNIDTSGTKCIYECTCMYTLYTNRIYLPPFIQFQRPYPRNVSAKISVNARALNAQ